MAVEIKGGSSTDLMSVDPTHKAGRISVRPVEALGGFRVAAFSGLLTGTAIVASAPLFSARWTDASKLMLLVYLRARYVVTTVFTTVQELGLDAIVARSWSVSDSVGTAITLTGSNAKKRASGATSVMGDMRIAATTLLTAGTRTLDSSPFVVSTGITHDLNPAAATVKLLPVMPQIIVDLSETQDHPYVFAQNEGVIVRNGPTAFPAAGVARLEVEMAWLEVSAY